MDVSRVDEIVARTQADCRAPSVVAGVLRGGELVHVSRAGQTPAPDADTQYRIGSISKSFTAAVVLGLRDEGRLGLDDRLGEHLALDGAADLRLRQLLGQIGGLQREPEGQWWERSPGVPVKDLVAGITDQKVAFGPYQRFHYSNLGYGLLGAVIGKVTGQSWWEAVSTRLLEPLGMRRTTYQAEEPFARGYVVHPWHHTLQEEPRHDSVAMAPAGQMWSTVTDLARWAALLAATESTVVKSETVAEMAMPVAISDPDSWRHGYGLGLQLWRRGERVFVGHTGSMPGYLAVLITHRPTRTGVVAFTNTYGLIGSTIGDLGLSLMDAVVDSEPAPPPIPWLPNTAPPPEIEEICGRWWWMGREFEARWYGHELHLQGLRPGAELWRFIRTGTDHWQGLSGEQIGEVLTIRRDAHGQPLELDIATFVFRRTPVQPDSP
jgi:CubicO group peptidase (beta-lactamase class C family)